MFSQTICLAVTKAFHATNIKNQRKDTTTWRKKDQVLKWNITHRFFNVVLDTQNNKLCLFTKKGSYKRKILQIYKWTLKEQYENYVKDSEVCPIKSSASRSKVGDKQKNGIGGAKMGWICCFLSQTLATRSRVSLDQRPDSSPTLTGKTRAHLTQECTTKKDCVCAHLCPLSLIEWEQKT